MEWLKLTTFLTLCFLVNICSGDDYWYYCHKPDTVEMWIACNTRTSIEEKIANSTRQILNALRMLVQGHPIDKLAYCPLYDDGLFDVYIESCSKKLSLQCEGRRHDPSRVRIFYRNKQEDQTTFNRPWQDYKEGFSGENHFWIGLETLSKVTGLGEFQLQAFGMKGGNDSQAYMNIFRVEDEKTGYRLVARDWDYDRSSMDNFLSTPNGRNFSTFDVDNDDYHYKQCAETKNGGWWYTSCYEDGSDAFSPTATEFEWDEFAMFIQPKNPIPNRKCYGTHGDTEPMDFDW